MYSDEHFMQLALEQAQIAKDKNEVPVGAVITKDNKLIASGHNMPIESCNPTAHAEIVAITNASKYISNYRLINCSIYVTLEPCAMCAAALIHARIKRLIFAARDSKSGAITSNFHMHDNDCFNHKIEVTEGILQPYATNILLDFFRSKR